MTYQKLLKQKLDWFADAVLPWIPTAFPEYWTKFKIYLARGRGEVELFKNIVEKVLLFSTFVLVAFPGSNIIIVALVGLLCMVSYYFFAILVGYIADRLRLWQYEAEFGNKRQEVAPGWYKDAHNRND